MYIASPEESVAVWLMKTCTFPKDITKQGARLPEQASKLERLDCSRLFN